MKRNSLGLRIVWNKDTKDWTVIWDSWPLVTVSKFTEAWGVVKRWHVRADDMI